MALMTLSRMNSRWVLSVLFLLSASFLLTPINAVAQGQDSTPAQRNLLVIAETLPGVYDNASQNYFDKRRQLEESDRHVRINTTIERIEAPAFGPHAFLWVNRVGSGEEIRTSYRIATLSADGEPDEVTMRHYLRMEGAITPEELATLKPADLRRTDGCDYYFKRRASHYHGAQRENACGFDWDGQPVHTRNYIQLSENELWFVDHKFTDADGERITGVASGEPFWLERAREFHCYADIPGVGGGRDIPFERYENFKLHDKGGAYWFTTRDAEQREIGLILNSVTWHVLNENNGNFNRNSLVLYAIEKLADGSIKEHGYAFTEPSATRIGNNMKWMLVNCSITPRDEARPAM